MFKFAVVTLILISVLIGEHNVACQRGKSKRAYFERRNTVTTGTTTTTTTPVTPTQTLTEESSLSPENPNILMPQENKEIPANLQIQFARETNLTAFFLKYVENTGIATDNVTLEEYLINSNGEPILDGNMEKLYVVGQKSVPTAQPPITSQPPTRAGAGGGGRKKGRAGSSPTTATNAPTTTADIIHPPNYYRHSSSLMCYPENKFVPVSFPNLDPMYLLLPKCVSIQQCGGCCSSDKLACEPTELEDVVYHVSKLAFNFETGHFQHVDQVPFSIKRHIKCSCNCKVKAADCKSEHHLYSEETCSCDCQNTANRTTCGMDNTRIWDEDECACHCLEKNKLCSSGLIYDQRERCDCMPVSD